MNFQTRLVYISSADRAGHYREFGGTSAAAPLVTASLAGFEWLSGRHPTPRQAKMILRETAIPTIYSQYERHQRNGKGLINAYKSGQVALLLKKRCHPEDTFCFQREIENKENYQFPPYYPFTGKDDFERTIQKNFPLCAFNKENQEKQAPISCHDKKSAFDKLRKAALLNPSYKDLQRTLACIYESNGYRENALGLRRLGTVTLKELEHILNEITPQAAVRLAGNIGGGIGARHLRRRLEEHPKDTDLIYNHIPYAAGIMGGKEGVAIAQHVFNLSDNNSASRFAKQRAAYGFAENSDTESQSLLVWLAKDPDPDVKIAVTYARGLSGENTEALSLFFGAMFQDPNIEVKQAAVFGAGLTNDTYLLSHILHETESLEDEDSLTIKTSLLAALESLNDRSKSSELSLYMLEDFHPRIRLGAMIVGIRDDNIRDDILQKWVTDEDPGVKSQLPLMLATWETDKEVSKHILFRLLRDPEPLVRTNAVAGISVILEEQEGEARLIQMEREETDPLVRKEIAGTALYFNKETGLSIALRLTDHREAPEVRREAALTLSGIGGEAATQRLSEMGIKDPDPTVRNTVASAVQTANMEEEKKGDILWNMAQKETDKKVKVQMLFSASEIKSQGTQKVLELLAEDEDPDIKHQALEILKCGFPICTKYEDSGQYRTSPVQIIQPQ